MTDEELTAELAVRVLGWKIAPDRFIKSNRRWCPRWRFAPLRDVDCALELLDRAADDYVLRGGKSGKYEVEVKVGNRTIRASCGDRARLLTVALAHALGLDVPASPAISLRTILDDLKGV